MKLHIENLNITLGNQHPSGLIAALAIASAAKSAKSIPDIGSKWPGTEAIYAGISLSITDDSLVHLILWPDDSKKSMNYHNAVEFAEAVNPDMSSHIPTRHQSMTLYDRLQDHFSNNDGCWTLTKTKSGNAAFIQYFYYGFQLNYDLSSEWRVRAVSEIPI